MQCHAAPQQAVIAHFALCVLYPLWLTQILKLFSTNDSTELGRAELGEGKGWGGQSWGG